MVHVTSLVATVVLRQQRATTTPMHCTQTGLHIRGHGSRLRNVLPTRMAILYTMRMKWKDAQIQRHRISIRMPRMTMHALTSRVVAPTKLRATSTTQPRKTMVRVNSTPVQVALCLGLATTIQEPPQRWFLIFPDSNGACPSNCEFDADGDGICDANEIAGCIYSNAINFEPLPPTMTAAATLWDVCCLSTPATTALPTQTATAPTHRAVQTSMEWRCPIG